MSKRDIQPSVAAKKNAGYAAADFIENGMTVGLGTGSTAFFFIEALGVKCQRGLKISAAPSSLQTAKLAKLAGIPLLDGISLTALDITVDGADEVDREKNLIKGGGGALLREKLLAKACKEMVVIVDESKLVTHLGKHPLAVEIVSFAYATTISRIEEMGYKGVLRCNQTKTPYLTETGNYIFDIHLSSPSLEPKKEHDRLKSITGVIETGFFFELAKRVVIGYENGSVKIWK